MQCGVLVENCSANPSWGAHNSRQHCGYCRWDLNGNRVQLSNGKATDKAKCLTANPSDFNVTNGYYNRKAAAVSLGSCPGSSADSLTLSLAEAPEVEVAVAVAGFERLPQGQTCSNGTALTTQAECQTALRSLLSTLPAGCKDNTGCCDGDNLPYGCTYRSDNDFVFNDNAKSTSVYSAGNGRQAICHCTGGAAHCQPPAPPGPPPPPPPPPGPPPPPMPPKPSPPAPPSPAAFNMTGTGQLVGASGKCLGVAAINGVQLWAKPMAVDKMAIFLVPPGGSSIR